MRRFETKVRSSLVDYDAVVTYVITDDAAATRAQLYAPMYSSSFLTENCIPFRTVCFYAVYPED